MVHTVVFGRVEDVFQRPKTLDRFSMDPELIDQAELMVGHEMGRWYSNRHRQIENLQTKVSTVGLRRA